MYAYVNMGEHKFIFVYNLIIKMMKNAFGYKWLIPIYISWVPCDLHGWKVQLGTLHPLQFFTTYFYNRDH